MTSVAVTSAAPGRPSSSLHYAVGEISGKLDQVIANLLPRLNEIEANHSTLTLRVDGLEKWQARIGGGIAVIVIILGAVEVIRYVITL